MCNLSWTSPLLEKDNSKINTVYNTQKYECSQYQKKKKIHGMRMRDMWKEITLAATEGL